MLTYAYFEPKYAKIWKNQYDYLRKGFSALKSLNNKKFK